jgi:hypothetical protein
MNSMMGTEMVDIHVGPEKCLFRVHKDFLCKRVPYFDNKFNGEFQEASQNFAKFPEDNPAAFDLLLQWIYTGIVPICCWDQKANELNEFEQKDPVREFGESGNEAEIQVPVSIPIAFYSLAEKFCLHGVMDSILEQHIAHNRKQNTLPRVAYARKVYKATPMGSPYRQYMAMSIRYMLRYGNRRSSKYSEEKEGLQAFIQENDDFCSDFLDLVAKNEIFNPLELPKCSFHSHGGNEACTLSKNSAVVHDPWAGMYPKMEE